MADIQDLPVVLAGLIDANTITVTQTYDNVSSIYHGSPYYFSVDISILPLLNSDDTITPNPYQYDANHIEPGMWIAEQSGKAFLIVSVEVVDQENVTATLKDVNLFNLLSDYTFSGNNMPTGGSYGIIFKLSEDGIPIIPFVYSNYLGNVQDSSYWVATDVITRFQYRNLLKSHYNNSDSPNVAYSSYQVGQMVYLDSNGVFQPLVASNSAHVKKRFGVITSVNEPEDGDLGVRPWGKVVGDLNLSNVNFAIGDALYYDDTVGAPFLTATEPASSAIPMYIKISDTTGMYITDMVGGGGDQIYLTQVPDGTAMVEDHGGLDAGTLAQDIGAGQFTLSEMLDQILFPSVCPTPPSGQPNVTLSDNVSALQIIGDTINVTFTTGATLGQFSDGTTYAGDVTGATLTGAGLTNETLTVTAPTGIADYTYNNYTVIQGTQSWTLTGTFAQGPMPVDNFGADCADIQYNGGNDTATTNFEGVYPVYSGNSTQYVGAASGTWTTGSVNTTYWTQLALFSFNSAYFQWDQAYNEDSVAPDVVRHRFAIPSVLTVTEIKKYNPVSGQYDPIPTSQFTTTATTLDIFGNSVAYTIYEKSNSAGGASQYQVFFTD